MVDNFFFIRSLQSKSVKFHRRTIRVEPVENHRSTWHTHTHIHRHTLIHMKSYKTDLRSVLNKKQGT